MNDAEFGRHVRDCLATLYDVPYLGRHPLAAAWAPPEMADPLDRGRLVQARLLAAIETLRPEERSPGSARAQRRYDLMRFRYVDGLPRSEVCRRLNFSQAAFYKAHKPAVETLVESLGAREAARSAPAGDGAAQEGSVWEQAMGVLGALVLEPVENGSGSGLNETPSIPGAILRRAGDFLRTK